MEQEKNQEETENMLPVTPPVTEQLNKRSIMKLYNYYLSLSDYRLIAVQAALAFLFYLDILTDLVLSIIYISQRQYNFFIFTLIPVLAPILINLATRYIFERKNTKKFNIYLICFS